MAGVTNGSPGTGTVVVIEPVPFGRVPSQILGASLLYGVGLLLLLGMIIRLFAGPQNFYVYNAAVMLFVVFLVVPGLVVSTLTGVISYLTGSAVWFVKHRSHEVPSDLGTTLRAVPPMLLVTFTVTYVALLLGGAFSWESETYQGGVWWSLEIFSVIYVVTAVIGVGSDVYSGLRRMFSNRKSSRIAR